MPFDTHRVRTQAPCARQDDQWVTCHPACPQSTQIADNTSRFRRDGTNNPGRIPNFLNYADNQGLERHTTLFDRHTNTHAIYQDRLANTRSVLALADEVRTTCI
jgi:hypothetical protein